MIRIEIKMKNKMNCKNRNLKVQTLFTCVLGEKIKQVGGVVNLHFEDRTLILQELIKMEQKAQSNFLNMQLNFKIAS